MTHEEWHNAEPPVRDAGHVTSARPITSPADPRLRRESVHAEHMTFGGMDITAARLECAQPFSRNPGASAFNCDYSYLVSGAAFTLDGEGLIALFVSCSGWLGQRTFTEWAMERGGSCGHMSQWRTHNEGGRRMPPYSSQTCLMFAPADETLDLIGRDGVLCPGTPGSGHLHLAFHGQTKGKKRSTAFAVHKHCAVPRDLTGCAEWLVGPVVNSLDGLEKVARKK